MRKISRKSEVGTVKAEERVLNHAHFSVVRRVIATSVGERNQFVWDRRGKRFVVVLALDSDDNLLFVREPNFGQLRFFLSLPAGAVRARETPEQAALRELREETGYLGEICRELGHSLIDFPDKIDGGEHRFFLVREATCVGFPEYETVRVPVARLNALIAGTDSGLKLETAMSVAGVARFLLDRGNF